jgi:hypothetical protein
MLVIIFASDDNDDDNDLSLLFFNIICKGVEMTKKKEFERA